MAIYKWVGSKREDGVVRDGNMTIPSDKGNRHWKEFLEWEKEGNAPDPYMNEDELIVHEMNSRYNETQPEYIRRYELYTGSKHKGKDWEHSKYYRSLDKKLDKKAVKDDTDLITTINHLRDLEEALHDYIEDPIRTLLELQELDVAADIWWSAPIILT